MALDLTFTPEQEMLREMVRGVCDQYCNLDRVRSLEDDPTGFAPELWSQLIELDLVGLFLPVEYGGSGMGLLEGVLVYEEFGRALTPSPHFVSSVLAGGVLAAAGSEAQRSNWLPRIAKGESVFSVGWLEASGGYRPAGITTSASPDPAASDDGAAFRLTGTKRHVAFASAADHLVVLARTGGSDDDIDLFVVATSDPGVTLTQKTTIASDTQYDVTFDGVAAERIGETGTGWATWEQVMADGAVLCAAQAVGGARHTLDITVEYSKDRYQFDKPLGSFQSLSHYMADAVTAIDGGQMITYEAAWARDSGRPHRKLAAMAKLFTCNTYRDVTAMAQQIWGGVGFTLEYDVQLYFRRAKALQLNWWDTRALEEIVASEVLTPVG